MITTRKKNRRGRKRMTIRGGYRYEREPDSEFDEGFDGDDESQQYMGQELALDYDDVRELIVRYRNALTNMENRADIGYLDGIIHDLQVEEDLLVQFIAQDGDSVDLMNQALNQYQQTRRIERRLIDEINEIHNQLIAVTLDGGKHRRHRHVRNKKSNKRTVKYSRKSRRSKPRKSRK